MTAATHGTGTHGPGTHHPGTTRTSTRRLPGIAALGLSRTRLELVSFFRERDAVVFIFAYPILMLAIFASVFGQDGATAGGSGEDAVSFAQYFLPGMIATGMMLTSFQALATSLAVERDDGSLKRLRTTPLPPVAFFLGKIGQVLVVSLAQTTLLVAAGAVLFGIEVPGSLDAWVTFAWVFVLGTAVGTVCGIAFSSVPRSGRSVTAVVLPVVLVLQFTSGVFFVFSDLPTWMQRFAEVFPLKWMAQGMRSVFLPDSAQAAEVSGSWQHGPTAVILVAWLILGLVVCVRTFRWRRRDDG
jgi:ABC-2 type transport system permease protein